MPEKKKRCPDCGEKRPASEFYRDKRTKTGLTTYCRSHSQARKSKWAASEAGKATQRRRKKLEARVREALRRGGLDHVLECHLESEECGGKVRPHCPDKSSPGEVVWLCKHHRWLIGRLKHAPNYEQLVQLAEKQG